MLRIFSSFCHNLESYQWLSNWKTGSSNKWWIMEGKEKGFLSLLIRKKNYLVPLRDIPNPNYCWDWMPEPWLNENYGKKKGFNFQNPKFSSQDGLPKELIPQGVHMDIQWDIPQDTRNGNSQLVAFEKINWWFCTEKTDREELTPKGGVGWVCSHHNLGKEMENPWKLFLVFQLATHQWQPQPHKKKWEFGCFPVKSSSGFMELPMEHRTAELFHFPVV